MYSLLLIEVVSLLIEGVLYGPPPLLYYETVSYFAHRYLCHHILHNASPLAPVRPRLLLYAH